MKNLDQGKRQESSCAGKSWPMSRQRGQEAPWLTSGRQLPQAGERDPWQSGLELTSTQGRGKGQECVFIPPSYPLLVSSASHHPGQPQRSVDQTATSREATQPRSMGWVSGRTGRVTGAEILASCGKTGKPHPPLVSTGKALSYLDSGRQTRKGLSSGGSIPLSFPSVFLLLKTFHGFLLPKAPHLNSLARFSKPSIIWPQVI